MKNFVLENLRAAWPLFFLALTSPAFAAQQSVTTSTFSWGGGTMTIPANVVVGGPTTSFMGNTAAQAKLYTSGGTLVSTYTSTNGTTTWAAADAVTGSVIDAGPINFGTVSAGNYYLVYTGTKTTKDADFNRYWYALLVHDAGTADPDDVFAQRDVLHLQRLGARPLGGALAGRRHLHHGRNAQRHGREQLYRHGDRHRAYTGSNSGLTWTINKGESVDHL
ncbi:MAG: hypothetical protein WDM96_17500 [Lacunisphaera sp.]